jgi:recombinational DNA repair protein (RecF pathway)
VKIAQVEGPNLAQCARCGAPIALLRVGARSLSVQSAYLVSGDTIAFERHRCPVNEARPTAGADRAATDRRRRPGAGTPATARTPAVPPAPRRPQKPR